MTRLSTIDGGFLLTESPHSPKHVPLPANPVSLDGDSLISSFGRGALVILGLFVFAGLILRVRRF